MIHGRYRGVPFNSTFFQGLCGAETRVGNSNRSREGKGVNRVRLHEIPSNLLSIHVAGERGKKKKIRNELSQAFFPAIKCFKSPRRGTGEIHPSC